MNKPIILTIAGFDPSSGAGITADLRTFHNLNCFGAAVITAVTYQNTAGVSGYTLLAADVVDAQFRAVVEDYKIAAVKIGMLGNDGIADTIAEIATGLHGKKIPIIVDPIYQSGSGIPLYDGDWEIGFAKLIASAVLITPNTLELARLTGSEPATDTAQLRNAAARLFAETGVPILAKGGHIEGDRITDILVDANGEYTFEGRSFGYEVHGTGCLLSAALTAFIARGLSLYEAVKSAESYVDAALQHPLRPGRGQAIAGDPDSGSEEL
jgi:hydroxymethylpyrimidine/phosphomethylpyrimidine kinase